MRLLAARLPRAPDAADAIRPGGRRGVNRPARRSVPSRAAGGLHALRPLVPCVVLTDGVSAEDTMDQDKPALTLVRPPLTVEDLLALYRRLTGRKPTAEEDSRARARLAGINDRLAKSRESAQTTT